MTLIPPGAGPPQARDVPDEPPPFLGSWGRIYAAIIVYLVIVIALFGWFTKAFNR